MKLFTSTLYAFSTLILVLVNFAVAQNDEDFFELNSVENTKNWNWELGVGASLNDSTEEYGYQVLEYSSNVLNSEMWDWSLYGMSQHYSLSDYQQRFELGLSTGINFYDFRVQVNPWLGYEVDSTWMYGLLGAISWQKDVFKGVQLELSFDQSWDSYYGNASQVGAELNRYWEISDYWWGVNLSYGTELIQSTRGKQQRISLSTQGNQFEALLQSGFQEGIFYLTMDAGYRYSTEPGYSGVKGSIRVGINW